MLFLKQSTNSQSVLIGPCIDDTDGATPETGLSISNTDIRLSKNGGNLAAKNSGGATHDEAGWYQITLDATDTNTVGKLQLHCKMTGALMVHHEYHVLEESIYDALIGASAGGFDSNGRVDVGSVSGTSQTAGDLAALISTVDSVADGIQTDLSNGTDGLGAIKGAVDAIPTSNPTASAIADAVLDEALSGHTSGGTLGKAVADIESDATAILADTNELQSDDVPGLIAALDTVVDRVEADTTAILADTNELQTDDVPGLIAALNNLSAADVNAQVDSALDTAIPGSPTAGSINDVIKDLDAVLPGATISSLTAANVNAQVVDVMKTDTSSLPGQGAPTATPTLEAAIMYLYKAFRNRSTQTSSTYKLYADDATTVDQQATVSDNGTTFDKGEVGTGA